jgi:hypothetical protein
LYITSTGAEVLLASGLCITLIIIVVVIVVAVVIIIIIIIVITIIIARLLEHKTYPVFDI